MPHDSTPRRSFLTPVLILAAAGAAVADDPEPPRGESEEEIIVTATRYGTDRHEVPYTTDVVGFDEIRRSHMPRGTPDALRFVPGVSVQKTAHGHGSPYIRGLTSFHTLFLIDGVRLNNSVFRPGPNQYWNTVDPLSIQRYEVVKGPSSVLYGSDAVGGTVNAMPLEPWGGEGLHARTHLRWASGENGHTERFEISGTQPGYGFVGGFTAKRFGDFDAGRHVGQVRNSGYSEEDADFKLFLYPDDPIEIVFAWQRVNQDNVPRTHKTDQGTSWRGTSVGSEVQREIDQDRELFYVRANVTGNGLVDEATVTLSVHDQWERRDRTKSSNELNIDAFDVRTLGLQAQVARETERFGRWIAGAEYYGDEVDTFGINYNPDGSVKSHDIQGPVGDDATYDLIGVYLQNEYAFAETPLTLIPGIRFTRADTTIDEADINGIPTQIRDDWNETTGSLRGRYDFNDRWNLFGGVSQGFRAPNLSDLSRLDSARTDEAEIPSPGLDPEEFLQYEIGIKHRSDRARGELAWYWTDIHDYIDRVPTGNTNGSGDREVEKRNTGDGRIQGVEFGGEYDLTDAWTLSAVAAWQEGDVETYVTSETDSLDTRPLSKFPPASGTIGARWTEPEARRFWIEGLATITREQHRLSPADKSDSSRIPARGTPGYNVYTIRTGYEIDERFSVSAAIENVTNKDYRVHGSGQNEVGTNVILAVEARF